MSVLCMFGNLFMIGSLASYCVNHNADPIQRVAGSGTARSPSPSRHYRVEA